jgi:hypothetical protein
MFYGQPKPANARRPQKSEEKGQSCDIAFQLVFKVLNFSTKASLVARLRQLDGTTSLVSSISFSRRRCTFPVGLLGISLKKKIFSGTL